MSSDEAHGGPADATWREVITRIESHSGRLVKLEESDVRIEMRVTALESDRESVRQLVTTIGVLAEKIQGALATVDAIAERAVAKVIHERTRERKENLKHTVALVSAAGGAFGAVAGVAAHFLHVFH